MATMGRTLWPAEGGGAKLGARSGTALVVIGVVVATWGLVTAAMEVPGPRCLWRPTRGTDPRGPRRRAGVHSGIREGQPAYPRLHRSVQRAHDIRQRRRHGVRTPAAAPQGRLAEVTRRSLAGQD